MAQRVESGPALDAVGGGPAVVADEPSIWSPLATPLFRAVWIAALASTVGSWMHIVAAKWEMTSLSDSAALVGLVSTATALPAFALALPAGALADVVDRRRLIVGAQVWQLVVAALLGVLTIADLTTPWVLLAATVMLGIGAGLALPALYAVTAELVDRERLPAAISLNSMSFTASQAIGAIVGGLLIASIGSGWVFLLNAVSFVGVLVVLAAWHRTSPVSSLPPEHVSSAMRSGVRYVVNAPELRTVLLRIGVFILGFSAIRALLAVLVKTQLDAGASAFGVLFGCLGLGGVVGAFLVPRLRSRFGPDRVTAVCTLAVAALLAAMATVRWLPVAYPLLVVLGIVSIGVISSMMIAAQTVLPNWMRGRGVAMFVLVFQAALAAGAACWAVLADWTNTSVALGAAAVFVAVGALLGLRHRLADAEGLDVRPAHASEPPPPISLAADDGPVHVSVEYHVSAEQLPEFQRAAGELGQVRRRAGAMHWSLYADVEDRERQVEVFTVPSWSEHARRYERETKADRAIVERVLAFHRGAESPVERALLHVHPRHRPRTPVAVRES